KDPNSNHKDVYEYEEYRKFVKQDFLYNLLSLLETSIFDAGAVFIFCSNNFDTIFNDLDPIHFHSLKMRFSPLKFERCNTNEFKEYIRYFNKQLIDTSLYYDEYFLEDMLLQVNDSLSITYRA